MNKNVLKKFVIVALSPIGNGLSGGDRIFIELARHLGRKGYKTHIITWKDGKQMCERQSLKEKNVAYTVVKIPDVLTKNFFVCYITRILYGMYLGLTLAIHTTKKGEITSFYSASDFLMDVLPCFIYKIRYASIIWIGTWFQTAPNPLKGYTLGERKNTYKWNAFFYWFSQHLAKPFIGAKADIVIVNNENEKKEYPEFAKKNKILVILGGLDIKKIEQFKKNHKKFVKKYDAVFQGRFHPQKGVIEIIEIWKKVVLKKPNAKLVMIGDGYLMEQVKEKIKELRLQKNILLEGYVFDGVKKYTLFSESKMVVHPAFFDSGGMAAGEAMAFGLPGIGFNLVSYQSYYPTGMAKVPIGDKEAFAKAILAFLNNDTLRRKVGKEAMTMVSHWTWDEKVKAIVEKIRYCYFVKDNLR